MIDIHCHILSEVDDGPVSSNETLEMLKIAVENGIKKIIATPHYYSGVFNNNFDDVSIKVQCLNNEILEQNLSIEVLTGQEIFLDNNVLKNHKAGLIKGLNNTKYMLLELPFDNCPHYTLDILYELRVMGIIPIIAHPERYLFIINNLSFINNFIDEGCLFQINSNSLTGELGKSAKKTAYALLRHGIIDFIATDAHDKTFRKPEIRSAFDIIRNIDNELANKLLVNAENLISNMDIISDYEKLKTTKVFKLFK
jgi:protein-tyrosine phosphatase